MDIDLNDPEVMEAATKIQASFRGFQTRKEIAQRKAEEVREIDCRVDGGMPR